MEKLNSFEEWVLGLRQARAKGCQQEDEYFETVLDYPEWRILGLSLVLDCLDFRRDVIPGHCLPSTYPPFRGERRTAIKVFIKYLSWTCEAKNLEKEFHWAVDCISNRDLFKRMARSIRILKKSWKLEPEEIEPIKRLLIHVHENQTIFFPSGKGAREEFYLALADYEMYDLLPSSTLIEQTILRRDPQDYPRTWGEWLAGLMRSSDNDEYLAYLGTALDFFAERPHGVRFLLDIMDYSNRDRGIETSIDRPQNDRHSNSSFIQECKTRAADLIILEYLKADPHETGAAWVSDCTGDPALLQRIFVSLRQHTWDSYMRDETRHTHSAVKKFLKNCAETGWDTEKEFIPVRDQCLANLYSLLAMYGMPDLIKRRDESSFKALEQVVFGLGGPEDTYNREPPKDIHAALLCDSAVRRVCADRLVLLREIKKAKQLQEAIKQREKNRQARKERAERVLAKTQTPQG